MKKYVKGKELVYNGSRAVITAVNPDGTATLNYVAGSGKTGFAGTLPALTDNKINTNSFEHITVDGDNGTLYGYTSHEETPSLTEAQNILEDLQFYIDDTIEVKKYGTRDEFDSWEVNSNDVSNQFVDFYLNTDISGRKSIIGIMSDEQKNFVAEHADPDYRYSFIASQHVTDFELKNMIDAYATAEEWAIDTDNDPNDEMFTEGSLEREYVKNQIVELIASDPETFNKLTEKYAADYKVKRVDALKHVAADFFLKNFDDTFDKMWSETKGSMPEV
jgi:hypothetical protein